MAKEEHENETIREVPLLTPEFLAEIDDTETREVLIPAWGRKVVIRALSMEEGQQLSLDYVSQGEDGKAKLDAVNFYKQAIYRSLVEPRLTLEQVNHLYTKKAAVVKPVIDAIDELNGFAAAAQEAAQKAFRQ